MRDELSKALYSQNYIEGALDVGAYKKMRIKLTQNGKEIEGAITNFDEEGFVVKPCQNLEILRGRLEFLIIFEGNTFAGIGEIVTVFKESVGIQVLKRADSSSKLGWEELYSIIFKRNYSV
ncbi:hypothetical protein [Bacteriovorax sp. Seq25_V]|uniref:hypothetical protein n=1 Tax=Bacteriovorax sp. Seq25_V TaxID=1201288 RepID=UPI0018DFE610|nr:hypothetical protein [Bacteriovorax sp. Seq25_V]